MVSTISLITKMNKKLVVVLAILNLLIVGCLVWSGFFRSILPWNWSKKNKCSIEAGTSGTGCNPVVLFWSHKAMTNRSAGLKEDMKNCSLTVGMTVQELSELQPVVMKTRAFLDALEMIFPINYSNRLKNPCWYSNLKLEKTVEGTLSFNLRKYRNTLRKVEVTDISAGLKKDPSGKTRLLCLPYFFLAGFPKSGTTSLHSTLQQHPQIIPPTEKEPHWWTRIPLEDMSKDYLKLVAIRYPLYFTSIAEELATHQSNREIAYDATQSTLWDSNFLSESGRVEYCATPAVVSRTLPDAKFIVIMRNPVERAYSHYYDMCNGALHNDVGEMPTAMQEDPSRHFHVTVQKVIDIINDCMKSDNHSLLWCLGKLWSLPKGCGYISEHFAAGFYYIHLQKWMQFYPRENFLFLRTEDIYQESHRMMTQITEFLGVDPVSEDQAKDWLSQVQNVRPQFQTLSDSAKLDMRPETKELLEDFFEPHNIMLAELTGDKRFLWKDSMT